MLLLFDKPPDMRFGSVKKMSDASRLLSLKSFLCDVCSFLCYHDFSLHGREWISVAINGSMGRGARKASMFYIYSCLYRQLDRSWGRGIKL